jgi:putative holliday junction resolvase
VRVVGIDLGERRIGVAVSDPGGVLASPVEVVARSGDRATDHARLADLVDELGAERVVVGLPLSLSGRRGPAARAAAAEVDELAERLPVPVDTVDERLTTVTADRSLREAGVRGRDRRQVIDKAAAAVLLQTWLDGRARAPQGDR